MQLPRGWDAATAYICHPALRYSHLWSGPQWLFKSPEQPPAQECLAGMVRSCCLLFTRTTPQPRALQRCLPIGGPALIAGLGLGHPGCFRLAQRSQGGWVGCCDAMLLPSVLPVCRQSWFGMWTSGCGEAPFPSAPVGYRAPSSAEITSS